ncbi:MAG: class I tRNA ligase family protein, partial [Candidatus Korarchaeota archaeon]
MELDKNWDFRNELEILKMWENEQPLWREDAETIIIDTPPVYPSGTWHVGAVAAYSLIDMIARFERMKGKNVIFPFCLDRNGINIEQVIEKQYNKKLHLWDREIFIKKCKEEIDKYSKEIIEISKRIGLSADYKETYYETDSPEYRKFTQATFIELWNNGYIYEDYRPNFYCPGCGTTIAEAEIEYIEKETDLIYLRFKVYGSSDEIIVATTRPELLASCRAVLVNPEDSRYKMYHWKELMVPMYEHRVKVIPHTYAKMDFGSGAVMICSYGDLADIRLFRELQLEPVAMIDEFGRMKEASGKYKGMIVKEARRAIIEDLQKSGYIVKIEKTMHRTPLCSRSKDEIEFISTKELYLKQVEFKETLKKLANEMSFLPSDKYKYVLFDWIDG